jgi:NH3-dependent NAD+ synthetase
MEIARRPTADTITAHSWQSLSISLLSRLADESYEHDDDHGSYEVVIYDKDKGGHGHGHGHGHKKKKKKKKKKKGHKKKKFHKFNKIFKKKKHKRKKKHKQMYMKKFMMPLLIAYKLKFFTLIPVFVGKALFLLLRSVMKNLSRSLLFIMIQNLQMQLRMLLSMRTAMATSIR